MTFTIESEYIYLIAVLLLMLVQVIQWRVMVKLRKEFEDVWTQIGTLAVGVSSQLLSLQQELNKKEDKKSVKELIDK